MKSLFICVVWGFLILAPVTIPRVEAQSKKVMQAEKKAEKKKKEQLKQKEIQQKRDIQRHKKLQSKEVQKRMKQSQKEANRFNNKGRKSGLSRLFDRKKRR
jgi:biopolymer transport protein ExbB/TolQ